MPLWSDLRYCSVEEFAADAQLVFNNCELFNEDTSEVGKAGHSMRRFFESRWAEFYQTKDKDKDKWNAGIGRILGRALFLPLPPCWCLLHFPYLPKTATGASPDPCIHICTDISRVWSLLLFCYMFFFCCFFPLLCHRCSEKWDVLRPLRQSRKRKRCVMRRTFPSNCILFYCTHPYSENPVRHTFRSCWHATQTLKYSQALSLMCTSSLAGSGSEPENWFGSGLPCWLFVP